MKSTFTPAFFMAMTFWVKSVWVTGDGRVVDDLVADLLHGVLLPGPVGFERRGLVGDQGAHGADVVGPNLLL